MFVLFWIPKRSFTCPCSLASATPTNRLESPFFSLWQLNNSSVTAKPVCLAQLSGHSEGVNFIIPLTEDSFVSCSSDKRVITWKDRLAEAQLRTEALWFAAREGDVSEVKKILRRNFSINVNVNWRNERELGFTALHVACDKGRESTVAILLAHPDIDVNLKNSSGKTPFSWACFSGQISSVQRLIRDSRIQINEPDNDGYTPLMWAALKGQVGVIRCWIASGREMDLGKPGDDKTDVIGDAKKNGKTGVLTQLERFKIYPSKTQSEVGKLGINGLHTLFFVFSFHLVDFPTTNELDLSFVDDSAEVINLLERFEEDPMRTRSELTKELGITGESLRQYISLCDCS